MLGSTSPPLVWRKMLIWKKLIIQKSELKRNCRDEIRKTTHSIQYIFCYFDLVDLFPTTQSSRQSGSVPQTIFAKGLMKWYQSGLSNKIPKALFAKLRWLSKKKMELNENIVRFFETLVSIFEKIQFWLIAEPSIILSVMPTSQPATNLLFVEQQKSSQTHLYQLSIGI